jgi:hypothetical protein
MVIRHLATRDGNVTEALYEHDGVPKCSRFSGHINAAEASAVLERCRAQAAKVAYPA